MACPARNKASAGDGQHRARAASTASQATPGSFGRRQREPVGLSQHLHSLAASGSADIDTANVESIKQAIKDGTLQIDSGKIADGV